MAGVASKADSFLCALASPFLPAVLKGAQLPSNEKRRLQLRAFHNLLLEGYRHRLSGPAHLLDKMKGHWEYLANTFSEPGAILARIRHSRNLEAYVTSVDWVFEQARKYDCSHVFFTCVGF